MESTPRWPTEDIPGFVTVTGTGWPSRRELRERIRSLKRYEKGKLPWERVLLRAALVRRGVFARRPLHGNVLDMLRTGQLMLGRGTFLGANVHIRCEGEGRMLIGQHVTMNLGASASAEQHVTIGDHVLIGPGTYITDGDHVFSDVEVPVPDQGMTCKGPTVVEDNVWLGAHVVVTSGVRIGRRSVIGANSVVTHDIPPFCVAVGVPARVCRRLGGPDNT